jgi:hypothetical protein
MGVDFALAAHETNSGDDIMLKRILVTSALLLTTAGTASAQRWDAPLFAGPGAMDELGLFYVNSDRDNFENSNGLKAIWRQSGNLNLGVHVGTGDLANIGESILLGAELYGPIRAVSANTGLMVSWTAGIGAAFGDIEGDDYIDFSIPVGVNVGIGLGSGSTRFTPFVHPRISYDVIAITPEGGDEVSDSDFGFAVDLGAELGLGQRFLLRGAASLGDRAAFGVGVAMRTPRRILVGNR